MDSQKSRDVKAKQKQGIAQKKDDAKAPRQQEAPLYDKASNHWAKTNTSKEEEKKPANKQSSKMKHTKPDSDESDS